MRYSYDRMAREEAVEVDENLRHSLEEAKDVMYEERNTLQWLQTSMETFIKTHDKVQDEFQTLSRYLHSLDPHGKWTMTQFGPLISEAIKDGEPNADVVDQVRRLQKTIEQAFRETSRASDELRKGLYEL